MNGFAARVVLVAPLLGCAVLTALATVHTGAFRAIVREDSVLEWAEVAAYLVAAIVSVGLARRASGLVRYAYAGLAICALVAIGEELSWGQRLFDIGEPERLAAVNRQQELNVHNLVGAESATRLVILVAALYGAIAPVFARPGPFVPPRVLVPAFTVAACYFSVRFLFLPRPTYVQAKFSEWPELCFAVGVALAARNADFLVRRSSAMRRGAPSRSAEAVSPQEAADTRRNNKRNLSTSRLHRLL